MTFINKNGYLIYTTRNGEVHINKSLSKDYPHADFADILSSIQPQPGLATVPNVYEDLTLYSYVAPNGTSTSTVCLSSVPRALPIRILSELATSNGPVDGIVKNQEEIFNSEFDNMHATQQDLENIKAIMNDNIDKVLELNERLGLLVDKTDRINYMGKAFRGKAVKLKKRMWWGRWKVWATGVGVVGLLGLGGYEIL